MRWAATGQWELLQNLAVDQESAHAEGVRIALLEVVSEAVAGLDLGEALEFLELGSSCRSADAAWE
jgi:hypothetical protein